MDNSTILTDTERDCFLSSLVTKCRGNYMIPPEAFENYNVKRGLRNADGTGVMAGITRVGVVHGYIVSEGDRTAVPGKLFYRGYDVEDLIEGYIRENRYGFEECSYILLFGELPTSEQLDSFCRLLNTHRRLPNHFTEDMILRSPSKNVMNKLASSVLNLYPYDDNPEDQSLENVLRQCIGIIAALPVIAAHAYAVKRHVYDGESLTLHNPLESLNTSQNFLRIVHPDSKYNEDEARLLDLCLVLHAEHGGGNNSAFSCRVLSSSGTDTYSAISAAIGSLKGPKHGGANIKVNEMFDDIKANVRDWNDDDEVASYLMKILKKEAGDHSGLIYGMGHAVYTLSDPRAILLKQYARKLAGEKGYSDEFSLLETIERLTPGLFSTYKNDLKAICANVDMYSGLVYRMLRIPEELFTPLFAISRVTGWCSHRIEELITGGRIIRPAYKSLSAQSRYIPIDKR